MSTEDFGKELQLLNPEQRRAVDEIYGPVMVIAGPGTGKTQILAMRIGNILVKTDAHPQNILCLTYTEAGTVAMRKRLSRLIGAEAYNIHIHTFHGFCNQIILDYSELFSAHHDLRPVDDLERLNFYMELIDSWPNEHPLKKFKGDIYSSMKGLKELFKIIKSEGWTSDFIISRIDQYISELPGREGFYYKRANKKIGRQAGDPHTVNIAKRVKQLDRLKAAAHAFDEFSERMNKGGRYDYEDMILWVLNELRRNEDLLYDLKEQYQFILVDEYQDTNGAQNDILFLLCGQAEDQPNVFVVGDDDQAIYRFQGANLSNILNFEERLGANLFKVVLKNNYRSSDAILQAADVLIDHNNERLNKVDPAIDKKLYAAGPNKTYQSGTLIGKFESETEELLAVQYYVEQLLQDGVDPAEIAIFFRKRAHVAPLIKYFITERIPYQVKKIDNVLTLPFILKLLSILRYIQSEKEQPLSNDFSLFEILHFDWFDIPSIDIAHLALNLRSRTNKNWRVLLADSEQWQEIPLSKKANLESFVRQMEQWIKIGVNGTIQELFENMIYSPAIFNYIQESGEIFHYLKSANTFFNFIKDQMDKQNLLTLGDFLEKVDRMTQYEIDLPEIKIEKAGYGIQLMTAHGSKGLEFEHVVVIGCNSKKWEEAKPPPPSFTYPDTLIRSNTENKVEDERRLFYVCLTRAKKEALLTYSNNLLSGKTAAPSRFIVELEEGGFTQKWNYSPTTQEKEKFLMSQYAPLPAPDNSLPPQVDDLLENLRLNISGVNKYLACPLSYYYENILKAPMGRSASMGFGNAVHFALDQIFKNDENQVGSFPSLDKLLYYFGMGMNKYHSHFTSKEFKLYKINGEIKLKAYYTYHIDAWKQLSHSRYEYHAKNIHIEGIPVSGIFDRLDEIDHSISVVDYKTGKASPYGVDKLKPPVSDISELQQQYATEQDPEKRNKIRLKMQGGDYWRQLVFYKLLLAADGKITKPFQSAYMSFVESDEETKYYHRALHITPDHEAIVRDQLLTTFENIQNKKFGPGCGRSYCKWCSMQSDKSISIK